MERKQAWETIESLGMAELLKENKCWEYPPIPSMKEDDFKHEDDTDNNTLEISNDCEEDRNSKYPDEVMSEIKQLEKECLLEKDVNAHLINLHTSTFKRVADRSLPVYDIEKSSQRNKMAPKQKHCPFVQLRHNGKLLYTRQQLYGYCKKWNKCLQTDSLESEKISHLQHIMAQWFQHISYCLQNNRSLAKCVLSGTQRNGW